MRLRITNDEDIEIFRKNTDNTNLILEIPIENGKIVNHGGSAWTRSIDVDDLLFVKTFKDLKFGKDPFRCYYGVDYTLLTPAHITFSYNNYTAIFNNVSSYSNLHTNNLQYTLRHLRKNNTRTCSLIRENKVVYLELNWSDVYSEIMRINKRVKTTTKKAEIKKMGVDFKMLYLHGKLIQDGVNFYEKSTYSHNLYSKPIFGRTLGITLLSDDKGTDVEIDDDTKLKFDVMGSVRVEKYSYVLRVSKAYENLLNVVNEIGESK